MHFIGLILVIILFAVSFILLLGFSLLIRLFGGIRKVWDTLTGVNNMRKAYSGASSRSDNGSSSSYGNTSNMHGRSSEQGNRPRSGGQVFGDDEGTYVEFEEVKER